MVIEEKTSTTALDASNTYPIMTPVNRKETKMAETTKKTEDRKPKFFERYPVVKKIAIWGGVVLGVAVGAILLANAADEEVELELEEGENPDILVVHENVPAEEEPVKTDA